MYTPSLFREADVARLFDIIEAHPFGTLVAQTQVGGLEISHLPFLFDRDAGPRGELRFHVARANPIWRAAIDGGQVVTIFSGPHAYVSPRWYERPNEQVPTWNYAVVHVHGRVEGPLDPEETRSLLEAMVARYEARPGNPSPWSMGELDPAHAEQLVAGIVGLTIRIDHLEGKFKLSQNRDPVDRDRVIDSLAARGGPDDMEVARLMRESKREL
ncbi:MAG TPA: FMN-binding negative transcriptional regulator [Candidatus Nanopelagicales bacterium]|nr:FMN-binding negative transcriptional regulator [Candidatus Nanopelagicales bacterium]